MPTYINVCNREASYSSTMCYGQLREETFENDIKVATNFAFNPSINYEFVRPVGYYAYTYWTQEQETRQTLCVMGYCPYTSEEYPARLILNGNITGTVSNCTGYTFFSADKTMNFGDKIPFFNNIEEASKYSCGLPFDITTWIGGAYPEPPITYNWQSVPSISGKNGILTLSTLNDVNDGEPVETSDASKFNLTDDSNVSALVAAHFSQ